MVMVQCSVNQRRILTSPGIRANHSCFEENANLQGVMSGADRHPTERRHRSIRPAAYAPGGGGGHDERPIHTGA